MPTQHGRTPTFKHLIRPDGSIRVITKGPARQGDDEALFMSSVMHTPPTDYRWDFSARALHKLTDGEKTARDAASSAVRDARTIARRASVARFNTLMETQPAEVQELLGLMAELSGLDLT